MSRTPSRRDPLTKILATGCHYEAEVWLERLTERTPVFIESRSGESYRARCWCCDAATPWVTRPWLKLPLLPVVEHQADCSYIGAKTWLGTRR